MSCITERDRLVCVNALFARHDGRGFTRNDNRKSFDISIHISKKKETINMDFPFNKMDNGRRLQNVIDKWEKIAKGELPMPKQRGPTKKERARRLVERAREVKRRQAKQKRRAAAAPQQQQQQQPCKTNCPPDKVVVRSYCRRKPRKKK